MATDNIQETVLVSHKQWHPENPKLALSKFQPTEREKFLKTPWICLSGILETYDRKSDDFRKTLCQAFTAGGTFLQIVSHNA